ncbi:hypothetical protein ABZ896_24505 [Streptomyces sp. NPDC047072]|uniref:hypothetical protein n=1 Tax=Streptomyces sp. NPDC047072 TaxID=3154809 RepID=UPI0033C31B57
MFGARVSKADAGDGLPEGDCPSPDGAGTPEEFMVRLRQLKEWTGFTYRELGTRSRGVGDQLPRSTLAGSLRRNALPSQDFVATHARAGGHLDLPTAMAALTGLWLLSTRVRMIRGLMGTMAEAVLCLQDLRMFAASTPDTGEPLTPVRFVGHPRGPKSPPSRRRLPQRGAPLLSR